MDQDLVELFPGQILKGYILHPYENDDLRLVTLCLHWAAILDCNRLFFSHWGFLVSFCLCMIVSEHTILPSILHRLDLSFEFPRMDWIGVWTSANFPAKHVLNQPKPTKLTKEKSKPMKQNAINGLIFPNCLIINHNEGDYPECASLKIFDCAFIICLLCKEAFSVVF